MKREQYRPTPSSAGRRWPLLAASLTAWLACPPLSAQNSAMQLRINEILSSNRNTQPLDADGDYEDMVEIYNPTQESISLKGYFLANRVSKDTEGKYHPVPDSTWKIPAGSIQALGFVLIFCDGDAGIDSENLPHASFKLDQDGEVLALFTPAEELIDLVPFPRLADSTSYQRSPDGTDTFCHSVTPSFKKRSILQGGATNAQNRSCANIDPEIDLQALKSIGTVAGANPPASEPLPIIAETWDDEEDGVTEAVVLYRVDNGPEQTAPLAPDAFVTRRDPFCPLSNPPTPPCELAPPPPCPPVEDKTRRIWKGEIPGQAAGSVVTFVLKVTDKHAATGGSPRVLCGGGVSQGCDPPFQYHVAYQYDGPIVLNEVMPLNCTTIRDATDGAFEDYIEIYSAVDVQLDGMTLSSSPFHPVRWEFPPGSSIKAGELKHLLIWCDNDSRDTDPAIGEFHASFALSNEGEAVFLFDTEAKGRGLIDGLQWGPTAADSAWSRNPDGDRTGTFSEVAGGSPRKPNGKTTFVRGDVDGIGGINITDPVLILGYLFLGTGDLDCPDAADIDDSGGLDLSDPINLLNYMFLSGPPPAEPRDTPGVDPNDDELPACK